MNKLPQHIAIIMDGNGRWAEKRGLPRVAGHKIGADSVREVIKTCARQGIKILTLFAFSTENWLRPKREVNYLMRLFFNSLKKEVKELHKNNVQLGFIGDRMCLSEKIREQMENAEAFTAQNTGLKLVIALSYSGKWDITNAMRRLANQITQLALKVEEITEERISEQLCLHDLPPPDLLIRTGGEQRISNFMLWQIAYAELYFTEVLWPDFREADLLRAIAVYAQRDRRFGLIDEAK